MYKTILTLVGALLFVAGSITFTGCGQASEQNGHDGTHEHVDGDEEDHHAVAYQCPMQCEGDKTYAEAGKCPKCGMAMEKMASDDGHGHDHGHEH